MSGPYRDESPPEPFGRQLRVFRGDGRISIYFGLALVAIGLVVLARHGASVWLGLLPLGTLSVLLGVDGRRMRFEIWEAGFVQRKQGPRRERVRWDEIERLVIEQGGMKTSHIGPIPESGIAWVHTRSGAVVTVGQFYGARRGIVAELEARSLAHLLPGFVDRLNAGERLDFSPFSLSREGLEHDQARGQGGQRFQDHHSVPWSEVAAPELDGDQVIVTLGPDRISNFQWNRALFVALIDYGRAHHAAPPDYGASSRKPRAGTPTVTVPPAPTV